MSTIKILENKQIDKNKWDLLLSANTFSFPYSASWYLDIVSPGWKAIIVNDYEFILPLPTRKKWGINYVYPPDFTQQMGIIGKTKASDELVNQILEHASLKFSYLEFNLNHENELKFSFKNLKQKSRKNFELDLSHSYDILFDRFHKNTKRNIKKLANENLSLIESEDPELMISTFQKFKGKQIKGLSISFDILKAIFNKGRDKHLIEQYHIVKDNEFLGAALFINTSNRKVFLFSAINDQGRKNRAMFFLLNEVIKKYADQNLILDFEGSDDSKLSQFYQRFGAKETLYLHLKINRLPFFLKWLKD